MERATEDKRFIEASAEAIYKAITDPAIIVQWQVPGDMTGQIHRFDLREGGGYQMSLCYPESEKTMSGKSGHKEDRFTAKFVQLDPPRHIVQSIQFETENQDFSGEMIMEITLNEKGNGTEVIFVFKNIPAGISLDDNHKGTKSSMEKLARIVTEN